jgi:choline dehydrogenase-like flavoprotein
MTDFDCDAVIVGSGPAGATAADVLTEAGWSVIILEKGPNHLLDLEAPYALNGHLSNDEIKFTRRHFLGPDPLVEPRTFRHSEAEGDHIHVGGVNNMPTGVGGAGFHADAKLPRFREVDFHTASELGPIDGSDLVDWPIEYDELEPYYAAAEKLVGVAGDAQGNPFASWRADPYPMPPGADMYGAILTSNAATELGYHPYRAPTGVNSVEYDGRPACNNCGFCGGYGCPIDAKGDPVAPLRRALRTGRCEIRPESYVSDIVLDPTGKRTRGVRYLDAAGDLHETSAKYVILACGAFETPRLLLRTGVGNSSDLVGRYLMYHFQTFAVGSFDHSLHGDRGRSVTHLHDDHMIPDAESLAFAKEHGLPYFRGGLTEHGGGGSPVMEGSYLPFGPAHTQGMLDSMMRDKIWAFTVQGEDLPQATNRVDLDPKVRDWRGFPAGRVTYSPHKHELVASRYYGPKLTQIMERAGARFTFTATSPPLPGSRGIEFRPTPESKHVIGTCRMGTDPRTSVVDPWHRFHDVDNLLCTDSSVFPTSTGYGPTLTIVTLAMRACRALADLPPLTSTRP